MDSKTLDLNLFFDEILIEVFLHLSLRMLKSCRLVCKRWDKLISMNTNFIENNHIVLRPFGESDKLSEIRRKPKFLVVLDDSYLDLDVFCHIKNLHSLKIDLSRGDAEFRLTQFAEVLRSVPNLKVLCIGDLEIIEDFVSLDEIAKIHFDQLIELNVNSELIHIFECSTLKILDLRWHCYLSMDRKLKVCEFISQQNQLENFALNYPNDYFQFHKMFCYKFKLKSFSLFTTAKFLDPESIKSFLYYQKHSLTRLKIQMYSSTQDKSVLKDILEYVNKNVLNIKMLEVDTVFRGSTKIFDILPTKFDVPIESFCFSDIFLTLSDNQQFVDMLPKMKHLSIKSCLCKSVGLLEYAASKVQLESLKVYNFDVATTTVTFPNLKKFFVQVFSWNKNGFNDFITRHSKSLEDLTIGNADDINPSTVDAIMNCENLKYLSLEVYNNRFDVYMNTFKDILSSDKQLTITFVDDSSKVRFELPGDKIFWDQPLNLN